MFLKLEIWQESYALLATENVPGNTDRKHKNVGIVWRPRPKVSAPRFNFWTPNLLFPNLTGKGSYFPTDPPPPPPSHALPLFFYHFLTTPPLPPMIIYVVWTIVNFVGEGSLGKFSLESPRFPASVAPDYIRRFPLRSNQCEIC